MLAIDIITNDVIDYDFDNEGGLEINPTNKNYSFTSTDSLYTYTFFLELNNSLSNLKFTISKFLGNNSVLETEYHLSVGIYYFTKNDGKRIFLKILDTRVVYIVSEK